MGSIEDGSSVDSTIAPDFHSQIALCEHPHHFPFPDLSIDAQLNQMCDFNPTMLPYGILVSYYTFKRGLSATVCSFCFPMFFINCSDR